jgi:hypothetical protein
MVFASKVGPSSLNRFKCTRPDFLGGQSALVAKSIRVLCVAVYGFELGMRYVENHLTSKIARINLHFCDARVLPDQAGC